MKAGEHSQVSVSFDYAKKTIAQIEAELGVSHKTGLSSADAQDRLTREGVNVVADRSISPWSILMRQLSTPFIYLLVGAAVLAFVLGEHIDALFIIAFVVINTCIGFYQEFKADQSIALLKKYITPHTTVLRDGVLVDVPASTLVSGDIMELQAGDIIPADGRVISVTSCIVDESILTGESVSVSKVSTAQREVSDIYGAKNIVFSGTTIVSGSVTAVVVATGIRAESGSIAHLTAQIARESEFAKGVKKFSTQILRLVIATVALMFLVNIIIKGESANIGELAIFSIALAVSIIPEALPLVTTLSLARGALKMAKKHVVVRRLSAIEDLGGVEILCTDKTGTITENNLVVVDSLQITPRQSPIVFGYLSTAMNKKHNGNGDPFDKALDKAVSTKEKQLLTHYDKLEEIPFDPERKRNTILVKHQSKRMIISRGAPEEILKLCRNSRAVHQEQWRRQQGMQGRRVIAVAATTVPANAKGSLFSLEKNLHLVGYVSFHDPIKLSTSGAVMSAEALGVKIKILTGDSPDVAGAVAKSIGLIKNTQDVVLGKNLLAMPADEQRMAIENSVVFARVTPEVKYKIISILQEKHSVGFLGEGINDTPALKAAGVSLVVPSAADVAREAADLVILQKNLSVIVDGIREGRMVFANTVKYIRATLASNFGNFYAVAIGSLFIDFLPMLPIQILLLNLLTDFPMISIAADSVDTEEVRMPKTYNARRLIGVALLLGAVSTVFDFIVFALFFRSPAPILQTNWFIASVLTELVLLFSIRTRRLAFRAVPPPLSIISITIGVSALAVAIPFTAIGDWLLKFTPPSINHLAIIGMLVGSYFIATECAKLLYYRQYNGQTKS